MLTLKKNHLKRLRQVICLALANGLLLLLLLPALSACGSSGDKPEQSAGPTVVRLAAPQNQYIEDFETNAYKLWLEEQTGLRIEMTWIPAKDAEQLVRLALTTGENLPDAYVGFSSYDLFSSYNLQLLGEQGRVLPLDPYIEAYGENLNKLFSELKEYRIREFMQSADGHFYYMPGFSSSTITRYRQIMWINKGWLESLHLPIPTTTEEFQAVLKAFATQDPNGNGIADEIPLCGSEEMYSKQSYEYLMSAFIYNDEKHYRLLKNDGQLRFAPITEQWRQGLQYMRTLYNEGLISPLSFTQDDRQLGEMATDSRDILGAFTSAGITKTVLQNSPEALERYVGIAPLTGPEGVGTAAVSTPLPKANGVITSACKNPEAVFRLFDLMLSEEACLRGRYGEKGVDWDFAKPGDISIYGTPATIKILNQIWNTPQNKHLMQIVPYVSRPKFSGGVTWDGNTTDGEYMNAQAALQYVGSEPEEYVGALIFTPDEENRIEKIREALDAQVHQTMIAYITGQRNIDDDADWNRAKEEYSSLGLQEFLDTAQAASDRMNR